MVLKKMAAAALTMTFLLATAAAGLAAEQGLGPKRYKADLSIDFQFERTIEIIFNPQTGNQKARVFEGPAKVSPSPPSPPGGELVDLEKDGDDGWSYHRNGAVRSASIKKDKTGRLIISYYTWGSHYAEGELKPVQ